MGKGTVVTHRLGAFAAVLGGRSDDASVPGEPPDRSHPQALGDLPALTLELAGLALRNARLYEDARDRARQLEASAAAAADAEIIKRELMDIAVHALRGPLTVIEGYADLLLTGDAGTVDVQAEEPIVTIRRQAAHARTLAEDLLILLRLDGGDLGVAHGMIPLHEQVTAAIERALPRARLRHGDIEARTTGEVGVLADSALLARILDNLLSNAVAYAPAAPHVVVSVSIDDDCAQVRVRDDGPGIPDGELELIFARFARGTGSRGVPGTGLGLYLSRECARRMNGDLELEESSAAGSSFLLTVPLAR